MNLYALLFVNVFVRQLHMRERGRLQIRSCVFKCQRIKKHDFQFPDTASVPFNPQTSKTGKKKKRKKKKTQSSSAQQIAQHNNPDCKVECTSPQERNKQVPQESWKMYEYKKLISSDRFLPPPRLICVFPLTVLLVQCIKNMNSRNRIRFNLHYLVMQLNYALLSVLIGTYSDRY